MRALVNDHGVTVVVASGNSGVDACYVAPGARNRGVRGHGALAAMAFGGDGASFAGRMRSGFSGPGGAEARVQSAVVHFPAPPLQPTCQRSSPWPPQTSQPRQTAPKQARADLGGGSARAYESTAARVAVNAMPAGSLPHPLKLKFMQSEVLLRSPCAGDPEDIYKWSNTGGSGPVAWGLLGFFASGLLPSLPVLCWASPSRAWSAPAACCPVALSESCFRGLLKSRHLLGVPCRPRCPAPSHADGHCCLPHRCRSLPGPLCTRGGHLLCLRGPLTLRGGDQQRLHICQRHKHGGPPCGRWVLLLAPRLCAGSPAHPSLCFLHTWQSRLQRSGSWQP